MKSPTLELINRSFEENPDISCKSKESVRRFIEQKRKKNRSHGRLVKLASNMNTILTKFAEPGFDLEAADQKDILVIVRRIDESDYSTSTKSDFKSMLKQVYRFFELESNGPILAGEHPYTPGKRYYPKKVDFFSTYIPLRRTPDTSKAFSKSDIAALTKACHTLQEKCIINVLYESGFRSGEFMELTIGCVKEDKIGMTVSTPAKDSCMRTVRLANSCSLLSDWLEAQPEIPPLGQGEGSG